ncbi:multidrug effflux MFS transporter [Flavobacterium sp.]|uniref:multidrug effflux MFS transporter n=1 Tax=Flavobacterium sp. TaxID=239 RepID=UPI00261B912E|nr:multidrug effflux MFS transporter [Flavobacterium sp.]MDD3005029.1 multidrug effflux MFS transporter [Flavobacterium sp.]
MNSKKYFTLVIVLGCLTALGPFSIDMYLPGFTGIAKDLNTTVSNVSLTLSSYFIGISAGQLLYGPLLDRYGRKKPLYIGLLVYILASLACYFVTSIDYFIGLRFIQAVGSCAASVAAMTLVRDLFPISEIPKVFAKLMLILGLSPMLAPTLGGYITSEFGWHMVFLVLTFMGIAVLLASKFYLPSNYQPDTSLSLKPKPIITNFISVIKEPYFYTYAFTGAVAFSGLFTYVASSPIIFMDIFLVDEKVYGWIFAILSISFIGTSQLNSYLLTQYSSEQLINFGLKLQFIVSIFFALGAYFDLLNLYSVIALLFLFLGCLGFCSPNTTALSLSPFKKNAGSASALMGAIQMGLGSLVSIFVGMFVTDSIFPVAIIFISSTLTALAILKIGKRKIKPLY